MTSARVSFSTYGCDRGAFLRLDDPLAVRLRLDLEASAAGTNVLDLVPRVRGPAYAARRSRSPSAKAPAARDRSSRSWTSFLMTAGCFAIASISSTYGGVFCGFAGMAGSRRRERRRGRRASRPEERTASRRRARSAAPLAPAASCVSRTSLRCLRGLLRFACGDLGLALVDLRLRRRELRIPLRVFRGDLRGLLRVLLRDLRGLLRLLDGPQRRLLGLLRRRRRGDRARRGCKVVGAAPTLNGLFAEVNGLGATCPV